MRTLQDQTTFTLLAIVSVYSEPVETLLSDGTEVMHGMPVRDLGVWTQWIGSIVAARLRLANVVLLRAEPTSLRPLGVAHHEFDDALSHLFYLLQLSSVIEYECAYLVSGTVETGSTVVQSISDFHTFHHSWGYRRTPVSSARLQEAEALRDGLEAMNSAAPHCSRLGRGFDTLTNGLTRDKGQERLHQFVRSLEAIIVPDIGKTRKQFIQRCQVFVKSNSQSAAILGEAFDMRSDAEHLHDWHRALKLYAVAHRNDIACQRTRQMELLARHVYSKLFGQKELRERFKTEDDQDRFWALNEGAQRTIWGEGCDLASEPLFTHYDNWGRALK